MCGVDREEQRQAGWGGGRIHFLPLLLVMYVAIDHARPFRDEGRDTHAMHVEAVAI